MAALVPAIDLAEAVVKQFVSHYAKRQLKASTAREVERILVREIVQPWRGRRLSQITRADIHDLLDGIVARGSPVTSNRTLAWLRRMCSWAIERGLIIANPFAGIKPPAAERARDRVLSDDELKAVWEAADALEPVYAGFIKLLILTGQRLREVSEMEWKEIDLNAKLWTLPAARAKNCHRVTKTGLVDRRAALLEIVRAAQPATVRQIFYLASVRGIVAKDEGGYSRVQIDLVDMRRSGQLPYGWIVDHTRWQRRPATVRQHR